MADLAMYTLTVNDILDRTTLLYGESNTGKSTIICDILKKIQPFADMIIVFCPTDNTNRTYSGEEGGIGIVPKPLINNFPTEEKLNNIIQRQEVFVALHKRAQSPIILESLFNRLNLVKIKEQINAAKLKRAEALNKLSSIKDPSDKQEKESKIEELYKAFFTSTYKRYITKFQSQLSQMNLTDDERHTLKYMNFNPRTVVIFDDCAANFQSLKTKTGKSLLNKIFYQGRHISLTVLVSLQDDKDMSSELRKNAFISIYTSQAVAMSYFNKTSNAISPEIKKQVNIWCKDIFRVKEDNVKLMYSREHNKFYKFKATKHPPFKFLRGPILELMEKIEKKGTVVDQNNKFFELFATDF